MADAEKNGSVEGMETDLEKDNPRKRKDISSVSELDTSGAAGNSPSLAAAAKTKNKKKKSKADNTQTEIKAAKNEATSGDTTGQQSPVTTDLKRQLTEINNKLSNVITL